MEKNGAGVICYRRKNFKYEYLLICKPVSGMFISILIGSYINYIDFAKLTNIELYMLDNFTIAELHCHHFGYSYDTCKKLIDRISKKFEEYRYLLKKYLSNYHLTNNTIKWEIPKGKMEKSDRNIKECAFREFCEETTLKDINFIDKTYDEVIIKKKNIYKITYFCAEICKLTDNIGEINNGEILCYKWFKLGDICKLRIDYHKKKILTEFNDYLLSSSL